MQYPGMYVAIILNCITIVVSESYYSIIAPGVIKSNHKYMVTVSLHEAVEPAKINIRIQGPFYHMATDVYLNPHETEYIVFIPQKLVEGEHKLVVEGISGIKFRNESRIQAYPNAGPKIYIQTDKAVFKPGDEVQFRVVMLDEHTRPLQIAEPIRVDITDGKGNRVKQFKDIALIKGVYKNKFQLSQYPVIGEWYIRVSISGKYDYSSAKMIKIQKYVLPKFSVYIKVDDYFLLTNLVLKALVYGKYTFDKYVEGTIMAKLLETNKYTVIQEKEFLIKDMQTLEFHFESPEDFKNYTGMRLVVELREKHTGLTHKDYAYIHLYRQPYKIIVHGDSIEFRNSRPYRVKATVRYLNDLPVKNSDTPMIMQHGSKEYKAYLNGNGEATFEFEHERNANHAFYYRNATYYLPNIFSDDPITSNKTESHLRLSFKEKIPRLGIPMELEVSSIEDIPYLIYTIVGHANIIHADHITLRPHQKTYSIQITPSIEMVPYAFVYVHYIHEGQLRYDEIQLTFPLEFENKISVLAPKQVKPGQKVTLELKAQPKSYVGVLAVDLGVYILDSSYDLQKQRILQDLKTDVSVAPINALVYPGLLSGVLTLTNAHYNFVPLTATSAASPARIGPLKFRKKFPETWIFENYEITNATTKLTLDIPETITTWRVTAFSVNEETGFGIVDGPTDITTIQPFFISLNLPYSVKRGEIVAIPILVHNYHNQSLDCEITLFNQDGEFYFMESTIFNAEMGSEEQQRIKRLQVPSNGVATTSFLINPKQVGDLSLRITATNPISSDAIVQKLKVEPEGLAKRHNEALYISVSPEATVQTTFFVKIPQNIVPDSEFITLSVGGNSLVPTLKNLNSLVTMPTGCGEQNMVNFAPNILVLQYLRATGKYFKEKALAAKAKRYIEIGFQQQLSYRHDNGGYSVFGSRKDEEASTWLTAYVVRFFIKAIRYLAIEGHIVDSGLAYLASTQLEDGSFPYTGYLFYSAQQNRFGFTAFVLITFLEQQKFAQKYETNIENGLKFLNNHLDGIDNIYALSIMAVALHMAKDPNASKIVDKLMLHKQTSSDRVWWTQNDRNPAKDVEITAYVLMALLMEKHKDTGDDALIHKWLTEQRNERGGFKSTHDTVVGLEALEKFSKKYHSVDNLNLKLKYSAENNESIVLKTGELIVDANNMLILQTEEFPISTRKINIETSGMGHSLLQLYYHFHTISEQNFEYFPIEPKPKMLNAEEMLLEICFSYRQSNAQPNGSSSTNMIIMEVNLPSGFTSSDEYSKDLLENEIIERIESTNSETTLVIYFEKLSSNINNCLNIMADKIHSVVHRKPCAIAVYDYYNITRHDTAFYSI